MAAIATIFAPKVCNVELEVRRMIRTALSYENVFAKLLDLMALHYGNHPTKTRGDIFEVGGTCAARACKRAGPFPPSTPQVMLLGCSSSPDT
jgi:hypothetical protein